MMSPWANILNIIHILPPIAIEGAIKGLTLRVESFTFFLSQRKFLGKGVGHGKCLQSHRSNRDQP